jgi:LuxR family maltose regulon positive regulatory protein
VRYQQNDLPAAEALFRKVVERPYRTYGTAYVNSVCGLAMTCQAQGKEIEAREITETGIAFLLETGNTSFLPILLALQAELALMQDWLAAASQWARKLDPLPPLAPMAWFLTPHLTLVKVWLAQDTAESCMQAAGLLAQLEDYLRETCNTRFLIETLALRALLEHSREDQSAALAALDEALRLGQPGRFIRLFVDMGSQMGVLLSVLRVDRDLKEYVQQIRSALPDSNKVERGSPLRQGGLLEPLTNRELQILELLGERLSNKEIAAQLVISPGTVKGHTIQIYQKLEVNNRRQAVEKAIALGLLERF